MHEPLSRYAELLIRHGLNVQPGQIVNISAEVCHREFVLLLVEEAYRAGAKIVDVELSDPRTLLTRLNLSSEEDLDFVPAYLGSKYEELVTSKSANLKIVGSEFPDILKEATPKRVNQVRVSRYKSLKYFYEEGIGKSKVHWTVAAAATPAWGEKLFPHLKGEAAEKKLWEELLKIVRADSEDCLDLWRVHNQKLHSRASALNQLQLREIRFLGAETDLRVELSPLAIFKGGSDTGPSGAEFEPNIPTEEVFTTPDCRKTQGKVKTTRPFFINGVLVENLELYFENGEIRSFNASHGKETFEEYINSDPGAKRLGEVALVGIDSPVYQSGLVFQEILLDENAACHIAIGSAYKFCLTGGATLSPEQLNEIGCNESSAHTDMMISDESTNVIGTKADGSTIELISNGQWNI
jgi:aminopeptidase